MSLPVLRCLLGVGRACSILLSDVLSLSYHTLDLLLFYLFPCNQNVKWIFISLLRVARTSILPSFVLCTDRQMLLPCSSINSGKKTTIPTAEQMVIRIHTSPRISKEIYDQRRHHKCCIIYLTSILICSNPTNKASYIRHRQCH